MFYSIYKNTLKTILRSRTAWLALALVGAVISIYAIRGGHGYYDMATGEMIYDTDPRYILSFERYRQNLLMNYACGSTMHYLFPLFAIIATLAVLLRDFGDLYFEVEKAGNVRPLSYYLARLLGIMSVVMVVAIGLTFFWIYGYVFSRGGVGGYSFGFVLKDVFLRVWKYIIGLMLPILLAIVSATLCLGNLFHNALFAALGSLAYLVANYLYHSTRFTSGWQPYFDYLSTTPDKLYMLLAAYDREDPIGFMNLQFTNPKLALICVGIAVGAALFYSIIAQLRTRSREI